MTEMCGGGSFSPFDSAHTDFRWIDNVRPWFDSRTRTTTKKRQKATLPFGWLMPCAASAGAILDIEEFDSIVFGVLL